MAAPCNVTRVSFAMPGSTCFAYYPLCSYSRIHNFLVYLWFSMSQWPTSEIVGRRCLRSADTTTLQVPSTRRATLGDRAFPVAAARAWNSLPWETRACSSLLTCRRETKSHLFRQSYGWRGAVYSDGQQTSALSCATVLYLDFVKSPATVWWQHCNPWHL